MTRSPISETCLNGWWDILPCFEPYTANEVPQSGWLEGQYLVPSFWTKPTSAVRKKGEAHYRDDPDRLRAPGPAIFDVEDAEFLFDAFGYPSEWSRTRSAWLRRMLTLESLDPTLRYHLVFDALMPRARLFINGHAVSTHAQPTLPLEADVTPWLHAGDNEIAVLIEDYDRDDRGRTLVPTGNAIPCDHSGIWQDVRLVTRAEVSVSDITIRTSTRAERLTVLFEVTNASNRERHIVITSEIHDWVKNAAALTDCGPAEAQTARHMLKADCGPLSDDHEGPSIRSGATTPTTPTLPHVALALAPGAVEPAEFEVPWPDAKWWYPEAPKLYVLRATVLENETTLEVSAERFGFREVWIEGPDILLNGYPMHLFSDWGHKWTPYYITEGWIRQWFGMIRDANMNHSRLHTHPHPPITLDLADEEGILITGEAGLHGSGGAQGANSPAYWEAAADHVRRFVRRDKNHPSLVLWSVENEMRWNTKRESSPGELEKVQEELPKLRALFNTLDPTRPAYHEGDTSLWNERTQPIISRHYGKECAGIGWWDQQQPLHSGEMALYHYAGPNSTLHLGGDRVYADFDVIDDCAARDAAWIIETGRTLGVSCFGPWNLSCLENLRSEPEDTILTPEDVTSPGMKPLRVPAHSSEFSFWKPGAGYTPNTSFAIQACAFRPLAVIDRSLRSGYFAGAVISRELFVVNDTQDHVEGDLVVMLSRAGETVALAGYPIALERGRLTSCTFEVPLAIDLTPGVYRYAARFISGERELDAWERPLTIAQRQTLCEREPDPALTSARIAVLGPGTLRDALSALGCRATYTPELSEEALAGADVLIMEKQTIVPGSTQNRQVQAFVQGGGRLILMEQTASLFPALTLVDKPVLKAFVRAYEHPVVEGLTEDDLFAWGEAPYPLLASDAYVALSMYCKDDGSLMLPLLDSGEGGFGTGDLDTTPLFEAREGAGLILACQMRVSDKLGDIPAAEALLVALLRRAITYRPEQVQGPIVVAGSQVDELAPYARAAREGQSVLVAGATPTALAAWSEALGLTLAPKDVGAVYQVVRTAEHPLLAGVSNEDTCGIETFSYTPPTARNTCVGTTFLAPASEIEALLQTPTRSYLRELMVDEGHTEALRAHTLTRCREAQIDPAVALGVVHIGKGRVVFNQFAPQPPQTSAGEGEKERPRLARLRHRLPANLGLQHAGSLLAGERVPAAPATGVGYPQALHICAGPVDAALHRQMLECCEPTLERMVATPILALADWRWVVSDEGVWRVADLAEADELYLYHTIWSPSPRKNLATNLDVPNPEALTFLDLEGSGRVEVAVNGRPFARVTLDPSGTTVSDISLEMGGNHVLLRWTPDSTDSILEMRWRDIMRRPETGLQFGSTGSGD